MLITPYVQVFILYCAFQQCLLHPNSFHCEQLVDRSHTSLAQSPNSTFNSRNGPVHRLPAVSSTHVWNAALNERIRRSCHSVFLLDTQTNGVHIRRCFARKMMVSVSFSNLESVKVCASETLWAEHLCFAHVCACFYKYNAACNSSTT